MMAEGFSAGDWIDRLAGALSGLAVAQEPYLSGHREIRMFLPAITGVEDGGSPAVRVEELGDLYARARHSHLRGEEAWYAALNAALDFVQFVSIRRPRLPLVSVGERMEGPAGSGWNAPTIDDLNGDTEREFDGTGVRETTGEDLARLEPGTGAASEVAQSDGERLRRLGIRRMVVMDVRDDAEPG